MKLTQQASDHRFQFHPVESKYPTLPTVYHQNIASRIKIHSQILNSSSQLQTQYPREEEKRTFVEKQR